MLCSNEHYMSISHMAIFVYMATQQQELQEESISCNLEYCKIRLEYSEEKERPEEIWCHS